MSGDHNQFQKPKSYLDDMNEVRKALEMALEALEGNCTNPVADPEQAATEDAAITALRQALAQPEQEPVAFINVEEQKLEWAKLTLWHTPTVVKLPKIPLYTAPPKREWVGLTGNEARKLYDKYMDREELIHAIDKFLEEKNNG